jgi:hypothetical protein
MPHDLGHPQDPENRPQHHQHHSCGNLFGCGDEKGTGVLREDIKDAAYTNRVADRLLHMDEMNQERLDRYLTARSLSRRRLLRASSFMAALATIGPWFTKLAHASDALDGGTAAGPAAPPKKDDEGRVHVVECNDKTVRLGVYDTTSDQGSLAAPLISVLPTGGPRLVIPKDIGTSPLRCPGKLWS